MPDGQFHPSVNIDDSRNAFFTTTPSGKCVPRVVIIDLEPTVIGMLVIYYVVLGFRCRQFS